MNPCSAEFRSFAGYQIIDYAQPCDPRVHVLLPSLEKSVGEMTVPFRKSLVPFIFSSPPETHPCVPVWGSAGDDHMCLPPLWRLGTYWPWDRYPGSFPGVHLGEGTKGEHREGESRALLVCPLLTLFLLHTPNWPPLCPIHPLPHLKA